MVDATLPRLWVPSIFIDDICPKPRARPEDWIAVHPNGARFLFPDDVTQQRPVRIDVGDVVRFRWVIDHGMFEVTLHPNGSWTCDDPLPDGANGFMEPSEPDSYATSMDQFAKEALDVWSIVETETVPVHVFTWSGDLYFQLAKGEDKALTFRRVANLVTDEPTPPPAAGLSFAGLRTANLARQSIWCPDAHQQPDLAFRAIELAGETGEALNVIKKLERESRGWVGSRSTKMDLADELADVVICADLTALSAGIDLEQAVRTKFNATSTKVGIPVMIAQPQEA